MGKVIKSSCNPKFLLDIVQCKYTIIIQLKRVLVPLRIRLLFTETVRLHINSCVYYISLCNYYTL